MHDPVHLKDHDKEDRLVNFRFILAAVVLLLMILVLVVRLFYLQVIMHDELATKSDENRIHLQPLAPTRGLIYDDKGRLVAENLPSYTLTITRERAKNIDKTLAVLKPILGLEEDDIDNFKKRSRARRPFEPVALKFKLTQKEIAEVAVNQYRLPGVEVEGQLVRYYPYKGLFAHSVGYVGRINDRELAKLNPDKYAGTDVIGKIGIERYYEKQLLGQVGYQEVETNASGRVLRVLNQVDPKPGDNLRLYLDVGLQEAAVKALGGHRGAVVALDPETGGVLAMASTPSFDPNLFVTGISSKNYSKLRDDIDRPLYNRASMGEYPPASTIKPMMALAALDSGAVTPGFTIFDPGYYQLPGDKHKYRNWKRWGQGRVNLEKAIMVSNDTYFYHAAVRMGIDTIYKYMTEFGLGERTGLDMYEERPGLMPSRAWKKGARGQVWYPGETVITGIGQGFMLATPMQMAVATAVIANHGKRVIPKLVQSINGVPVNDGGELPLAVHDKHEWDYVINAMHQVISNPKGTAYRRVGIHLKGYDMAGKTGTAQVVGIAQDARYDAEQLAERHRDHSLFVGFAPIKDPKIAIAVIVENGANAGEYSAAPVAKRVVDAWLLPKLALAEKDQSTK